MKVTPHIFYLVIAFLAVPSAAFASIKCDSTNLLSWFEPEVSGQLINAEGAAVVPRGAMFAPEKKPAFLQIRSLVSSSVRDLQVQASRTYRGGDVEQVLLADPQLVKISGGGLMRPLLLALPKSIDLAAKGSTLLEKRVDPVDPSRNGRDVVISSLRVLGASLIFEQQSVRRRGDGMKEGAARSEITSSSTRTIELHGKRSDGSLLVSSLTITVSEPEAGENTVTQIAVDLPQPLVLKIR